MKVVLFNSAPRSGKDLSADYLAKYINNKTDAYAVRYRFAQPLKEATHALYGISAVYDFFEEVKDAPNECFFGKTPRAAYIEVSEKMVKPVLGNDHWGKVFADFAKAYHKLDDTVVIVSDCGFIEEIQPIKNLIGAENIHLVRLKRKGATFVGDSRSFIEDDDIPIFEIVNDDLKTLHKELERFFHNIIGE